MQERDYGDFSAEEIEQAVRAADGLKKAADRAAASTARFAREGAPSMQASYQPRYFGDREKKESRYGTDAHLAMEEALRMLHDPGSFFSPPPPEPDPDLGPAAGPGDPLGSPVTEEGRHTVTVFLREGPADGELMEQVTNEAGVPPMSITIQYADPDGTARTPGGLIIPQVLVYELAAEQPSANAFEYTYKGRENPQEQEDAIDRFLRANPVEEIISSQGMPLPPGKHEPPPGGGIRWYEDGSAEFVPGQEEMHRMAKAAGLSDEDIAATIRLNRLGKPMQEKESRKQKPLTDRSFSFGISLTEKERIAALETLMRQANRRTGG